MSNNNMGVIESPGSGGRLSGKTKVPKEHFSLLQSFILIVLTIAISTGGWYAAGKYYFWSDLDQKRIDEQITFLQQKLQAEPKNKEYRVGLGYSYFLKGKNELAIKELNKVIEADKNYYDAYYNLGLVFLDSARLDDAMEMFQKCVEISPRDYKGYVQRGITYRKLGMYKEAIDSLQRANELLPRNADIIYQIGMVAEAEGDKKGAAEVYKDALSYDPLYKDAVKALERVQ